MAMHIRLSKSLIQSDTLSAVISDLKKGAVVVFPTETVYGIGTNAFSFESIRKIYSLKGRRWSKPLALLVPSLDIASPFIAALPKEALRVAKHCTPGPLTFVFEASPLARMVMGGTPTVGVRIPDHPTALQILNAVKVPLATTSANPSGEDPAINGAMASAYFKGRVDWLLEGGACKMKTPSTVIDFSSYPFTVIREGAISKKTIERWLHEPKEPS